MSEMYTKPFAPKKIQKNFERMSRVDVKCLGDGGMLDVAVYAERAF